MSIAPASTLLATVAELGSEAEAICPECGGKAKAATTADDEQSFHMCWRQDRLFAVRMALADLATRHRRQSSTTGSHSTCAGDKTVHSR
ncbi:MAG: hypothetical protein AB7R00_10605 [Kofleriaceae bacterium]